MNKSDTPIDLKSKSLYARLKRLFSTDVIVRNVGGKMLKIKDTDQVQYATDRNITRDRFNRVRTTSGYGQQTKDFNLAYQASRLELFRDYDCVGPDTIIPLPDGTRPTIAELTEKYKDNPQERFYVFSYDHETDSIKLGKAYHPRKKSGKRQGYKVTFDNGQFVVASLKHPFMMRDGTYKRTFELRVGDSIMPFYRKDKKIYQPNVDNYREFHYKECPNCKEMFGFFDRRPTKFCSTKCYAEHRSVYYNKENCPAYIGKTSLCENCGVEFKHKSGKKYCSRKCSGKARSTVPSILGEKICEKCNTNYNITPKNKNSKYCSNECRNHVFSTSFNGENHYSYIGGRSSELRKPYLKSSGWNDLCEQIRKQYDYTCVECAKTEKELNETLSVHHILSPRLFENPLDANNEKNLLPLCRKCHPQCPDHKAMIDILHSNFKKIPHEHSEKIINEVSFTSKFLYGERFIHNLENNETFIDHNPNNLANHKIISIEQIGEIDVYDVTVEKYENFATDSCFVSNTMDMDPIISSALDIYSDECLTENELGYILTIKSSDNNVKKILENLFYDILNIEFNLWSWSRNMCKYGDFYLKLHISPEYGVYLVEPLSSYNVLRIENSDPINKNYVKYRVELEPGMLSELENYQVAHFRLVSDSNFMPYGKSMIEGARRVWKQLSLMEDAMLIHRIMRAPDKRVFKIDVGNIPPGEVDTYMEKLINKTKKVPYIDERTGDYNLKFNLMNMVEDFYLPVRGGDSGTSIEPLSGMEFTGTEDIEYLRNKMMSALKIPKAFLGYEADLCVAPYTKIPLLNGEEKSVSELINDYNKGIKNYVYSIDEVTKNIVPGEVEWAGYTRKNAEIVRVHLDNGQFVDCTPDHTFMTRDGRWVEAQNLLENEPLMPLYRKKTSQKNKVGYETVYHPSSQKYQEVHRIVAEHYGLIKKGSGMAVHHKDFNKLNNYPENFDCSMTYFEHRTFHSDLSYKTINSKENILKRTSDPKWLESMKRAGRIGGMISADKLGDYARTHPPVNKGNRNGLYKNCPICNSLFYTIKSNQIKTCSKSCYKKYFIGNRIHNSKYSTVDFDTLVSIAKDASSFKELEIKLGNIDRNTLNRIFLANNIHDKHSFICEFMPKAKINRYFMNNFKKEYKNHTVVRVEKLKERIDTCDIRVKNYHNFAVSSGVIIHNSGKATLASEDVRFARTIARIQRILVSELSKIAVVHLYSQGYKDASLVDFSLELTNPSTIFEKEKISIWADKVSVSTDMMDNKLFSKDWVYKNIFKMSEDDVLKNKSEIVSDAKESWRFSQIEDEGNDPALSLQKINKDGDVEDVSGSDSFDGGSGGGSGGSSSLPSGGMDATSTEPAAGAEDTSKEPNPGDETAEEEPTSTSEKEPEKESPLAEKSERPSQKGKKKASDYPFGEDPLGNLANNEKSKIDKLRHRFKNDSPLGFESINFNKLSTFLSSDPKKELLSEIRGKKSFLDVENIINDQNQ